MTTYNADWHHVSPPLGQILQSTFTIVEGANDLDVVSTSIGNQRVKATLSGGSPGRYLLRHQITTHNGHTHDMLIRLKVST